MSKPVKSLIIESYRRRFAEVEGAVLVSIRGLESGSNTKLRADLNGKNMQMAVVKNSLAKQAFNGTPMEMIGQLLDGPCAMVFGGESVVNVARVLIDAVKTQPEVEFRGALMEGILFGPNEIEALSKYPTRDEAIANTITLVLSPARNLAGAIASPGAKLAGIIKAIEEKAGSAA